MRNERSQWTSVFRHGFVEFSKEPPSILVAWGGPSVPNTWWLPRTECRVRVLVERPGGVQSRPERYNEAAAAPSVTRPLRMCDTWKRPVCLPVHATLSVPATEAQGFQLLKHLIRPRAQSPDPVCRRRGALEDGKGGRRGVSRVGRCRSLVGVPIRPPAQPHPPGSRNLTF